MIISEDILTEIFKQLPPYIDSNLKTFPIKFEWGNQNDLLLYLEQIAGNKYPLIWLVGDKETNSNVYQSVTKQCRLIIAKQSNHITNRNPTVWKTEFKDCLNPLLENIIKAIERSGLTSIVDDYSTERNANYTEEDLIKSTDFWNVIILDVNIKFENRCINENIKFN